MCFIPIWTRMKVLLTDLSEGRCRIKKYDENTLFTSKTIKKTVCNKPWEKYVCHKVRLKYYWATNSYFFKWLFRFQPVFASYSCRSEWKLEENRDGFGITTGSRTSRRTVHYDGFEQKRDSSSVPRSYFYMRRSML